MDLRRLFVRAHALGDVSMTELCEHFGVSRKTGYKWVARVEQGGLVALADQSRRPHQSPRATAPVLIEALCAARRRHPTWGARKLLAYLRRHHPCWPWPAPSTGSALLKAHGLVRAPRGRRRGHASPSPVVPATAPNEVWTTDFKGEFRLGDRAYCYPLTLRDLHSRFVLRCDALPEKSGRLVQPCFLRAFREYGLPTRIRSDNGGPFAAPGLTRLSHLSVWWVRLGIRPERIAPGHPEQNGAHEQFHRVLKAETARPPAAHRAAQQRRFRRFCQEYNTARPHEALQDQTPARVYRPSPRPFPERLPPVEYPGHWEVRRVARTGQVSWDGAPVFLTEVLGGEHVAFEEVDDGLWMLHFATIRLARFEARTRTLTPVPYA
jgi:transposase InsO family protein